MKVMVNGLPGKMASEIVRHVIGTDGFEIVPVALSGPNNSKTIHTVDGVEIELIKPRDRISRIEEVIRSYGPFISVDYTHPSAVNTNTDFYCGNDLPFVMGTTGGDREALEERVRDSGIVAVVAPNMAKQIVAFQAMMQYAAETFPGAFRGYTLEIAESHQRGKADTSGTARAMVRYFNDLGIPFTPEQIVMVRDPKQQSEMGVPEDTLTGHAWHTYTLKSERGDVLFKFTHNVNGRGMYADGTLDALRFLDGRIVDGETRIVYSMMDVLKMK